METKSEYVEKLSAQIVEWDAQIDQLKFKADSSPDDVRYQQAIEALSRKRHEAELKLQGISASSEDSWEELKTETEQITDQVKTLLRDAILKIK